ncbi:MAG: hypothetical protein QM760_12005 [Nibricoccus sp.]
MTRNWHKHVGGLRGEELTAKLDKMSQQYEFQKLGSRHLKHPLR